MKKRGRGCRGHNEDVGLTLLVNVGAAGKKMREAGAQKEYSLYRNVSCMNVRRSDVALHEEYAQNQDGFNEPHRTPSVFLNSQFMGGSMTMPSPNEAEAQNQAETKPTSNETRQNKMKMSTEVTAMAQPPQRSKPSLNTAHPQAARSRKPSVKTVSPDAPQAPQPLNVESATDAKQTPVAVAAAEPQKKVTAVKQSKFKATYQGMMSGAKKTIACTEGMRKRTTTLMQMHKKSLQIQATQEDDSIKTALSISTIDTKEAQKYSFLTQKAVKPCRCDMPDEEIDGDIDLFGGKNDKDIAYRKKLDNLFKAPPHHHTPKKKHSHPSAPKSPAKKTKSKTKWKTILHFSKSNEGVDEHKDRKDSNRMVKQKSNTMVAVRKTSSKKGSITAKSRKNSSKRSKKEKGNGSILQPGKCAVNH
ncbi:hypothetical protein Q1695_015483 [Nippostrongylus brasiliensis]|nr:hypothetical protein Q1695_015483 [Nippostrongylus brasiliensis]